MSPTQLGKEFRDFLFKTNVFSMALGVVIGNAVTKVVDSLVKDIFMPVIGLIAPAGNWRRIRIPLRGEESGFMVGSLMGAVADFVIIAVCVFVITKIFIRTQAPPPAPPTKQCPECAEHVPVEAKRCKFCTSSLTPA